MKTLVFLGGRRFLIGSRMVYRLETGIGNITKIANSKKEFESKLINKSNLDAWLFAALLEDIRRSGIFLRDNEIYSQKILPALGGDYSVPNFEPTDISVHLSITG